VALLNSDHEWGRDLAIGAGAGLLIGGIFGAIDAAANADRAPVGFGRSYSLGRQGFSRHRRVEAPLPHAARSGGLAIDATWRLL